MGRSGRRIKIQKTPLVTDAMILCNKLFPISVVYSNNKHLLSSCVCMLAMWFCITLQVYVSESAPFSSNSKATQTYSPPVLVKVEEGEPEISEVFQVPGSELAHLHHCPHLAI